MKDYLQYLQEVLGIDQVMLSIQKEKPDGEQPLFWTPQGPYQPSTREHFELVFLNIATQSKESLFQKEVHELFAKMKSAMRLKNIQALELDATLDDRSLLPSALAELCEARYVVVFSSFPANLGEIILKGSGRWLETYSPSYLLEDADAKKVVWADLQKIMKELGL